MLDVVVISLSMQETHNVLKIKDAFPQMKVVQAVDMRKSAPIDLFKEKLITASAYTAMTLGRKWHHELPGPGGVGLYMSIKAVLRQVNPDNFLLLFEDDCVILPCLKDKVATMIKAHDVDAFDIVVFGPLDGTASRVYAPAPDFGTLHETFMGAHCLPVTACDTRPSCTPTTTG